MQPCKAEPSQRCPRMGVPAPAVPLTAVVFAVVAIFTCYIVALNGHHVPPGFKDLVRSTCATPPRSFCWPVELASRSGSHRGLAAGDLTHVLTQLLLSNAQPDITHCAMKQPERAIFLGVMMPSIMLQALSWVLGASALKSSNHGNIAAIAAAVGVVACGLLFMGESVLAPVMFDGRVAGTIHILGASGFFLLSMGAEVAFTWACTKSPDSLSPLSLRAKQTIAGLNLLVSCHPSVSDPRTRFHFGDNPRAEPAVVCGLSVVSVRLSDTCLRACVCHSLAADFDRPLRQAQLRGVGPGVHSDGLPPDVRAGSKRRAGDARHEPVGWGGGATALDYRSDFSPPFAQFPLIFLICYYAFPVQK